LIAVVPAKAVVVARERSAATGSQRLRAPFAGSSALSPSLLPVANRPLLRHALDWLDEAGVREVAVLTSDRLAGEAMAAAGDAGARRPRLHWLRQMPGETFGESLSALRGFLEEEPFVLHMADSLAKQSLASIVGDIDSGELEAVFVVRDRERAECPVIDIARRRPLAGLGCAGVAVLGPRPLDAAARIDAGPGRELETLAERLSQLGDRVGTRSATDWWCYGDSAAALLEGNRFALERLTADVPDGALVDSPVQGAVAIDATARIERSVIRGPAVIGARARLRDAYVGPYSSIGEDVLVEGAEIEHSVVLPGASIRHVGGRLEASVIGPKSRVFRDFRLPRALRLTVGEGAEVSLT
jgi:glucose-1-phosphate thymidylyltransferase